MAWSRCAPCVLHGRCGFTSVALSPPSDSRAYLSIALYFVRIVYIRELIEFSHSNPGKYYTSYPKFIGQGTEP